MASRNGGQNEVSFGVGSATDLLSQEITGLTFTAYEADGTTETETLADIHSIKCEVAVELPRETGGTHTVSCRAWLRSW